MNRGCASARANRPFRVSHRQKRVVGLTDAPGYRLTGEAVTQHPFSYMTRRIRTSATMVLVLVALGLAGAQSPAPLPTGTLVERVVCQGDSSQSYALYLPSGYASAK